jgi:uncharacterized protein YjaG (DUF416 family)
MNMVIPKFNPSNLKNRLNNFSNKQQLAFGVLCCERLIPNYSAFQNEVGWGDISIVRGALDGVGASFDHKALNSQEIINAALLCESVAPNSENFSSLYVTSAQDTCFAICNLLDFLLESDTNKIVQVATYATDSVDLYIQEIERISPDDPQLEQKILLHRLMQRELLQQEEDLKAIELASSINQNFLINRKAACSNRGKSNLDLI